MLLSALLTWLWPNQVDAQSILLLLPVVQAAPHTCSVPIATMSLVVQVTGGGMTCVPTKKPLSKKTLLVRPVVQPVQWGTLQRMY